MLRNWAEWQLRGCWAEPAPSAVLWCSFARDKNGVWDLPRGPGPISPQAPGWGFPRAKSKGEPEPQKLNISSEIAQLPTGLRQCPLTWIAH